MDTKTAIQIREALAFTLFKNSEALRDSTDKKSAWREQAAYRANFRGDAAQLIAALNTFGIRVGKSNSKKLEAALADLVTAPATQAYSLLDDVPEAAEGKELEKETPDPAKP